jgi:hypothetical protein
MTHIKRAATILVAAMTVVAAGCGDGGSSGPTGPGGNDRLGLYALMTANRKPIPVEIYHGPYFDETIPHFFNQFVVRVTGGELVLQAGGRYHLALDLYLNGDGEEAQLTLPAEGNYEIDGNQIVLQADGAPEAARASIKNGTITYTSDPPAGGQKMELVFKYVP